MKPLINPSSYGQIIKLLDFIYKKAIMDCIDRDDVAACRQFVKTMHNKKAYGMIEFDYEMTWREWKNTLYFFCLKKRLYKVSLLLDFINSIYTYYAVILPVSMEFYLKGVEDYIACPYEGDYLRFSESPREVWGRPSAPKTNRRMMDDMLQMVLKRRHHKFDSLEAKAKSDLMEPSPANYDTFTECMWRLGELLKTERKKTPKTVYPRGKERQVIVRKPKKS